jgi:hypothetical protein
VLEVESEEQVVGVG